MTLAPDRPSSPARTELVWAGKRTQVDRVALPFQRVETINAPRGADLFTPRPEDGGWRNKLIWGDNKLVMASLLQGDPASGIDSLAGKVDLIYIDPPFDTGADFSFRTQIGEEEVEKEPSVLEHLAYRDTWGGGTNTYLQMLYERLVFMRDLLTENGSLYLHVGGSVSAAVKLLLDEIFGQTCLRTEIIWQRTGAHNDPSRFGNVHETIYFYTKSENWVFNKQFTPYDDEYISERFRSIEEGTGRRYWLNTLTGPAHGTIGQPRRFFGVERKPPPGTVWRFTQENIDRLTGENRIVTTASGMPYIKQYLDESQGRPL
jgi:adenine-specific DNA-methyltransferase